MISGKTVSPEILRGLIQLQHDLMLEKCFDSGSGVPIDTDFAEKYGVLLEQLSTLTRGQFLSLRFAPGLLGARGTRRPPGPSIAERKSTGEEIVLFRKLADASGYGFCVADIQGNITYANRALCDLLGEKKPEDAIGKNLVAYYPDAIKQVFAVDIVPYVVKQGQWVGELALLSTAGAQIPTIQNLFVVHGEAGGSPYLANLIIDITDRKQAEEALKYRLEFEALISRISSSFINISGESIDDGINEALKGIGEFLGASRTSLLMFSEDFKLVTNTHEWCMIPEESRIGSLQAVPTSKFGHSWERLQRLEDIVLSRPDDLPPEAAVESEWFRTHGFCPLLIVPLILNRSLYGALGVCGGTGEEREWEEDLVSMLRVVGDLLASALERKRVDKALRESEERYHSLYSTMSEGVGLHEIVYDDSGNAVDYIVLDVNPAYEKMLGLPKEEVVGRRASERYGLGNAPFIDVCARVADSGKPWVFEAYFPPPEKHFCMSVFSPRKGQFATVFTDVTEQRIAEERLREAARRYRELYEGSRDGYVLTDMDLRIRECNRAFRDMVGYTEAELLGKSISDVTPGKWRALEEKVREQVLARGYSDLYEKEYVRKDGRLVPVELRTYLARNEKGAPQGLWAFARDIGDRMSAEEENAHLATALESLGDAVVITDVHGKIQYTNPVFTRMTGYTSLEAKGKRMPALVGQDSERKLLREGRATLGRGRLWGTWLVVNRKDGSSFTAEATVTPIMKATGKATTYVTILRDVTGQKRIAKSKTE